MARENRSMEGRERDQRKAVLLFSFIVSVEMGESVDKNNKIQSHFTHYCRLTHVDYHK